MQTATQETIKASAIFRLLADPTRLNILQLFFTSKREWCVYEVAEAVQMSQSATSHQLAKLEAHDIVSSYRDGQNICYALKKSTMTKSIQRILKSL